MGEARAVGRANGINAAFIIFQVEELAGLLFIQPIAIFFSFLIQPLRFEFINRFAEMRGDSFQVSRIEGRRQRPGGRSALNGGAGMRAGTSCRACHRRELK